MSSGGQDGYHQPLALDDIMHRLSPSPAPAPDLATTPNPHSISTGESSETIRQNTLSSAAVPSTVMDAPAPVVPSPRSLGTSLQDSSPQADTLSLGHRLGTIDVEPELLTPEDAQSIQNRLRELGYGPGSPSPAAASPRETELAKMVLRLLAHYRYASELDLSSQLVAQAESIASLTAQRDALIQQHAAESAGWQAEREGWDRSAEALIAQRSAASAMTKDHIVGALVARHEDETKRWAHKLAEQQHRLMSLESELLKLRPLLLIPPVAPEPTARRKHSSMRTSSPNLHPPSERSSRPDVAAVKSLATMENSAGKRPQQVVAPSSPFSDDRPDGPIEDDSSRLDTHQDTSSQTTHVDASSPPVSAAQLTLHLTSSQVSSHESFDKPLEPGSSHYRTAREREQSLLSPRNASEDTPSAAPPPSSNYYPRVQARLAASNQRSEASTSKQVMNPLWLATSRSRTRAERRAVSMLCDAKAELMLAAARRIGKRRVGLAAEFTALQAAEVEAKRESRDGTGYHDKKKEKGKARQVDAGDVSAASPPAKKSPRKKVLKKANTVPQGSSAPSTSAAGASYYASLPGMSHLVYLNPVHASQSMGPMPLPMGSGPNAVPVFMPVGGWPAMAPSASSASTPNTAKERKFTPAASDATPTRPSSHAARAAPAIRRSGSQGQSQGLDSLLNAARMLEDDQMSDASGVGTPPRAGKHGGTRAGPSDAPDELATTPLAKRRRVAPGTPASAFSLGDTTPVQSPASHARGAPALGKVSSALDVLADQAAQEHERRPSAGPSSRRRSPDADTPTQRAPAPRRSAGGRSRGGSGGAARGKQRSAAPDEPERHSSPEVSLSRKRRSSSMGGAASSGHPPPKGLVPPEEPEPSPGMVASRALGSSPPPLPAGGLENTRSMQLLETQSGDPAPVESRSLPPTTPSSDVDAPGSPESIVDQNV